MKNQVWIFIGLSICRPLWADDALLSEAGHNVYPINSESIVMEAETVNIKIEKVLKPINLLGGGYTKKVLFDCIFKFVNTGESKENVTIGFPGLYGVAGDCDLYDFKTWVDGKKVKINIREENPDDEFNYRKWYTWKVGFEKGETKTIRNTYWTYISKNWAAMEQDNWITYVLKTGSGWKGPIGKANITIDLNQCYEKTDIYLVKPEGYIVTDDGKIKWELKNFESIEDMEVIFNLYFQSVHAEKYLDADLAIAGDALSYTTKVIRKDSSHIRESDTVGTIHYDYATFVDVYKMKVDSVLKGVFPDSIIVIQSEPYKHYFESKFVGRDTDGEPMFVDKFNMVIAEDIINGIWKNQTKCIALLQKKDATHIPLLFRRCDKYILDFYKKLDAEGLNYLKSKTK